jgi:hypothetical protein
MATFIVGDNRADLFGCCWERVYGSSDNELLEEKERRDWVTESPEPVRVLDNEEL